VLVCCYPMFLYYTGQLLSETPVLMLIALALWLTWMVRNRPALWFGPVGMCWGWPYLLGNRDGVLELVKTVGIPIIDLDPSFRRYRDPLELFPFRVRGHYNEAGHRVVARGASRLGDKARKLLSDIAQWDPTALNLVAR